MHHVLFRLILVDMGYHSTALHAILLILLTLLRGFYYSRCPKYTSNYVKIDVGVFLFALGRVAVSIK